MGRKGGVITSCLVNGEIKESTKGFTGLKAEIEGFTFVSFSISTSLSMSLVSPIAVCISAG